SCPRTCCVTTAAVGTLLEPPPARRRDRRGELRPRGGPSPVACPDTIRVAGRRGDVLVDVGGRRAPERLDVPKPAVASFAPAEHVPPRVGQGQRPFQRDAAAVPVRRRSQVRRFGPLGAERPRPVGVYPVVVLVRAVGVLSGDVLDPDGDVTLA